MKNIKLRKQLGYHVLDVVEDSVRSDVAEIHDRNDYNYARIENHGKWFSKPTIQILKPSFLATEEQAQNYQAISSMARRLGLSATKPEYIVKRAADGYHTTNMPL